MSQDANKQKQIERLSLLFNSLGLKACEMRRVIKILREGIKYHYDSRFLDPQWVWQNKQAEIEIEPGSPPSHHQHELMFARLHYYRFVLDRIRTRINNSIEFNPKLLVALIKWDMRQIKLRDFITTCNMGLVLNMVQNCKYGNMEYGELISEGSMALLRVTECYDYRLGFHFSTYACRAIGKSFSRLAKKYYKLNRISYVDYDPGLEVDNTCQQLRQQRTMDSINQLRYYVLGNHGNLSEVEKQVLKMRFSVGEFNGNQMTLKDIGSILGLSKERIRQIQNQAVDKLGWIVRD